MLRISVNGEKRECAPGSHLAALLAHLGLDTAKVAIERNRVIIPRSQHATTAVHDGDEIEIIHFVGGG